MSRQGRILLVEDEADQRRLIAGILERAGYEVASAASVDEALGQVEASCPDLVLCDWRMPGRSGGELLAELRERELGTAFVVMTAYGSISHAMEAVRLGADDYLAKPFEREALLLAVRRVLRTRFLEQENLRLREDIAEGSGFGELIGRAPAMRRLYRTINKVAATEATVLIQGESGTGKELVARMLHRIGPRSAAPFVAVNCAAIPETLIESELFGHERGAFTGAHRRRQGRFEEAEKGTLLLDEISAMPLTVQATLLRVLQERRFTRLGGTGELGCDVRVVAASNRNLLAVVPVKLPPLRERREDIPLLAEAFLERASEQHGVEIDPIPPPVLRCLMEHAWPGNVRELANTMERLVLLAEDRVLRVEDLPAEMRRDGRDPGCPFRLPPGGLDWNALEAGLLAQALEAADWNRAAAARLLGLSYKTFLYRLDKHGMQGGAGECRAGDGEIS
jgi:two-component system NtrC family response regulator